MCNVNIVQPIIILVIIIAMCVCVCVHVWSWANIVHSYLLIHVLHVHTISVRFQLFPLFTGTFSLFLLLFFNHRHPCECIMYTHISTD